MSIHNDYVTCYNFCMYLRCKNKPLTICSLMLAILVCSATLAFTNNNIANASATDYYADVTLQLPNKADGTKTYGPLQVTLTNKETNTSSTVATSTSTPKDTDLFGLGFKFNNLLIGGNNYKACVEGTTTCVEFQASTTAYFSYPDIILTSEATTAALNAASAAAISGTTVAAGTLAIPTAAATTESSTKTCGNTAGSTAWLGCPIISALSSFNNGAWEMLEGLFKTKPLMINDASGSETAVYQTWGVMRNIANILFVIIFLIAIFSQITNIGLDNYGIKKILPKLVIGAILVNLSFIIMQVSFDLANIIGSGLHDLLVTMVGEKIPTPSSIGSEITTLLTGAGVGVAGVVMVGGPMAAWLMLIPVLLMAALALLAAILALVFRLAVIPILAIVSPLAFVAYLLPNTSSLFKKWKDLLMSMLLIYPIAALVFGGAQLASKLVMIDGFWGQVISMIVLVMPLGALPFIVSKGGAIMGAASGFLAGMVTNAKKPINDYYGDKRDIAKARRDEGILSGRITGKKWGTVNARRGLIQSEFARKSSKANAENSLKMAESKNLADRLINTPGFLKKYAGDNEANQDIAKARAILELDKLNIENVNAQSALIKDIDPNIVRKLSQGIDDGDFRASSNLALQTAAMQKIFKSQDIEGINNLVDLAASGQMNDTKRKAFAKVLEDSSYRPGWIGAGAIEEIKQGHSVDQSGNFTLNLKNSTELTAKAINNNTYSVDRLATSSNDELQHVLSIANNPNIATNNTNIKNNALEALTDPRYAGRVSKQSNTLTDIMNL